MALRPNRYKRYAKRNYRRGRRAYGKYSNQAAKALQIARAVQAVVNVEYKHHTVVNTTDASTTANVFLLNGIANGDTSQTRNGNSIKPKALAVNMMTKQDGAQSSRIRLLVVRDKDSSGTAPTITEVLTTNQVLSHYNIETDQNRFDILRDDLFVMNGDAAGAGEQTSNTQVVKRFNVPVSKHMKFDGSAATSVSWGALYAMVISDHAAGATAPLFDWNSQLKYIDN